MVDNAETAHRAGFHLGQQALQQIAKWALIAAASLASLSVILALAGVWPWLEVTLRLSNGTELPAGQMIQIGGALLLLSLCAFLPGINRMLELERSHRRFELTMEDVARAYRISHDADRAGAFALSSEFDSIRARLQHMRQHPDLARLEPDVMELAAQMSHTTRDLAETYSEEKIARAKAFLQERQEELDAFQEKLSLAFSVTEELKRWQQDVEASARETDRQIDRLEKDLREVLPLLGYELDEPPSDAEGNVVPMTGAKAPPASTPKPERSS